MPISRLPKGVLTLSKRTVSVPLWHPQKAHMPAVHPEMMIWGGEGRVPPHFCYLERYAKIQNRRQTPSGRNVSGRKEKETSCGCACQTQ